MYSFGNQLKQVLRRLRRAPMFTAITLVTLAAAIGANTVVFSVLEGVLLKPLPYPNSTELIGVWITAPGINIKKLELSPSSYFTFREQNHSFQDIGLSGNDSDSVTGIGEPEQVRALLVTDGTLPILGVQPLLCRLISRARRAGAKGTYRLERQDLENALDGCLILWLPPAGRILLPRQESDGRWLRERFAGPRLGNE